MKHLIFRFENSAMVELFSGGRGLPLAADLTALSALLEIPSYKCL